MFMINRNTECNYESSNERKYEPKNHARNH